MSAAALLDRLDRVKQTGPGRWIARCPAHEDRGPSLSIRELEDGRVLLHDFGSCGTDAVLAALGLTMSDLFPARLPGQGPARSYPATQSRIPARDLLELLSEEASVVSILAADVADKCWLSPEEWQRLAKAAERIHQARDHIHAR